MTSGLIRWVPVWECGFAVQAVSNELDNERVDIVLVGRQPAQVGY